MFVFVLENDKKNYKIFIPFLEKKLELRAKDLVL